MEAARRKAEVLRDQITAAEKELKHLKKQLAKIEASIETYDANEADTNAEESNRWPLLPEEYTRYGRQMIVPSIGIQGQLRLHSASILIVGVGGLGCPAAAYLAGAGIKSLGLVDGDTVELSNLHRQILHSTSTIGMLKVDSAIQSLRRMNPNTTYTPYRTDLTPQNAVSVFTPYDLILDCTDHPQSRYLISDTCVLLHKPLISASALRTDGQLTILNSPPFPAGTPTGGLCYRCLYPRPPPATQLLTCGDGGILGPVVGAMGVLQALEAIKLVVAGASTAVSPPALLIFSATDPKAPFRKVRLGGRRKDCFACSGTSSLTVEGLEGGSLDYATFCGVASPLNVLPASSRISAKSYQALRNRNEPHVLLDVREKEHFDICALEESVNVPISMLMGQDIETHLPSSESEGKIVVVCRLGNDSQLAVEKLREEFARRGQERDVVDVRGGLRAWRDEVDKEFPDY